MLIPNPQFLDRQTAKNLSRFAVAAYPKRSVARHRLKSDIQLSGGVFYYGEYKDAEIFVAFFDSTCIIGIAGTESEVDLWRDASFGSQAVDEWGVANRIRIASDSVGVRAASGFLEHTANALRAIDQAFRSVGKRPEDFKTIWITGHSLGGITAYLCTLSADFFNAVVVSFGAPMGIRFFSPSPKRRVLRVRNWRDSIPYGHFQCRHPDSVSLINCGSVFRSRIPWFYRLGYALAWLVMFPLVMLKKYPHGHNMSEYERSL